MYCSYAGMELNSQRINVNKCTKIHYRERYYTLVPTYVSEKPTSEVGSQNKTLFPTIKARPKVALFVILKSFIS
jgi:hypothetical protein